MASFRTVPARLPASQATGSGADEGVEGNSRLTAANGLLLTVLLAIEGLTILRVRSLITPHIFVGFMLLSPVALKVATTTYRFARYYLRSEAYVRRGPPAPWLRVLGPPLILATVAVLATGIVLMVKGPQQQGNWLFLHKATFIIWVVLMTLHFLGHIIESLRVSARDWRSGSNRRGRGAGLRGAALVLALAVGVGLGAAFTPGNNWSKQHAAFDNEGARAPVAATGR